jgi:hypothetical protein
VQAIFQPTAGGAARQACWAVRAALCGARVQACGGLLHNTRVAQFVKSTHRAAAVCGGVVVGRCSCVQAGT